MFKIIISMMLLGTSAHADVMCNMYSALKGRSAYTTWANFASVDVAILATSGLVIRSSLDFYIRRPQKKIDAYNLNTVKLYCVAQATGEELGYFKISAKMPCSASKWNGGYDCEGMFIEVRDLIKDKLIK